MQIPFLDLNIIHQKQRGELIRAFEAVLDGGWWILGEKVKSFEKEYADFNQTAHCIGVSNGLDALHIALKVLGIGNGDEVIIPSNTFIATVGGFLRGKRAPLSCVPIPIILM